MRAITTQSWHRAVACSLVCICAGLGEGCSGSLGEDANPRGGSKPAGGTGTTGTGAGGGVGGSGVGGSGVGGSGAGGSGTAGGSAGSGGVATGGAGGGGAGTGRRRWQRRRFRRRPLHARDPIDLPGPAHEECELRRGRERFTRPHRLGDGRKRAPLVAPCAGLRGESDEYRLDTAM